MLLKHYSPIVPSVLIEAVLGAVVVHEAVVGAVVEAAAIKAHVVVDVVAVVRPHVVGVRLIWPKHAWRIHQGLRWWAPHHWLMIHHGRLIGIERRIRTHHVGLILAHHVRLILVHHRLILVHHRLILAHNGRLILAHHRLALVHHWLILTHHHRLILLLVHHWLILVHHGRVLAHDWLTKLVK